MKRNLILALGGVCLVASAACGGDEGPCDPAANSGCEDGQVCEVVTDGEPACFDPVVLRGDVTDLGTSTAISGANIVALDVDRIAVSGVGHSNDEGRYEVRIPFARDAEGNPVSSLEVTLRADATGYQPFPGGVRRALPIDTATAVHADGAWVVDGTVTDVGLFGLEDASNTGTITGHVELPEGTGAIVVAQNGSGLTAVGWDAVVDRDGNFAILNLPSGEFTVAAYAPGLAHEIVDVALDAGASAEVDLGLVGDATGSIHGMIQPVEGSSGIPTTVNVFVESTFDATLSRGAAPPLLRIENVTSDFTIEGMPPGRYVVLAAFDNDGLVRDPDTCIAGTDIVHVEVADALVELVDAFKITIALQMLQPADGAVVEGGVPTFSWVDDSSEDTYRIVVYDSLGIEKWSKDIPGVSGSDPVIAYDGAEPLPSGMFYQVRVTSLRSGGTCEISTSEDLAGVFFVP